MILVGSLLAGASAQVMVTPEGWATTPGPAIGVYAPVLVTPVAHLETPQAAIGAQRQLPGSRSAQPVLPQRRVLTPTPPSIVPRVINAPPVIYAIVPQPEAVQAPSAAGTQPVIAQQPQSPAIDLGIAPIQEAGCFRRRSKSGPSRQRRSAGFAKAGLRAPLPIRMCSA